MRAAVRAALDRDLLPWSLLAAAQAILLLLHRWATGLVPGGARPALFVVVGVGEAWWLVQVLRTARRRRRRPEDDRADVERTAGVEV